MGDVISSWYANARVVRLNGIAMLIAFALMCLLASTATAQLSGTKTIGGTSADYASIDAAIAALNTNGVSGPVIFRINSGSYTPPSTGYVLATATGMSSTNTVTFKPAASATVSISGSIAAPVFDFNGGDYFIIDGSNATGGTSRDLTISNTSTSGMGIRFTAGATENVIKNVYMISAGTSVTYPMIRFDNVASGAVGNSNNTIIGNVLGDTTGTTRVYDIIYSIGLSTAPNSGNRIENNDFVNFGYSTSLGYGIYVTSYTQLFKIIGNRFTIPTKNSTGASYAIYWTNTNNLNDTIAYNKIWDLSTGSATAAQYGIYLSSVGTSPMTFHNNMISLIGDQGLIYGIYSSAANTAFLNFYYNSIYIGGSITTASTTSRNIYFSTYPTTTMYNNVLVNERYSTGTATNHAIYRSSTSGTFTCDNNVYWVGGNASVGYYGANQTTFANWQSVSGKDANGIHALPRFIDPATGNLHIKANSRTPVENRGTPVAGVTNDFDGATRNTSTPDVGADEGSFLPLLGDDISAEQLIAPVPGSITPATTLFTPSAVIYNSGTNNRTNVPVRMRIWDNSTGTVVYNDLKTVASLSPLTLQTVTFSQTGSVSGSTSLQNGTYTVEVRAEFTSDADTSNNAIYKTIQVKGPLSGTYTINRNGSGNRNFLSFTAAVTELQQVGVSGAVIFEIASGTYDGSTETFPLQLTELATMNPNRTVTFRPATGANVQLIANVGNPAIDVDGGDYFVLDGANTVGGTTRNWKVLNQGAGQAIRLINGATYNTIRNMNLMADNTTIATGIVKIETSTAIAGNSFNTIAANTIGDSSATYRSLSGIYLLGTTGKENTGNVIDNNDIINFGNGTGAGYGIYESTYNNQLKILRNRIRIAIPGTITGSKYGIYLNNSASLLDTVAYNRIWSLGTSSASTNQYGIYNNFQGPRPLAIFNNMVAFSGDDGSLYGIYNTEPDTLYVYYNSVHFEGNTSSTTALTNNVGNSSSTAVMYIKNNILSNTRTASGSGTSRIFYSVGGTISSDTNLIYANANGTSILFDGTNTYYTMAAYQSALSRDLNSMVGNPQFVNTAGGDLHISTTLRTPVEGNARPIAGITTDFDGNTRSTTTPDLGADEGTFLPLYPNDMAADRFLVPDGVALVRGQTLFQPTAAVNNSGTNTQSGVSVQYKITNTATGAVVYQDVRSTGSLSAGQTGTVTFNSTGSVLGNTSLVAGTYTIEVRTMLANDANTSNDVITGTITVRDPLSGLYTINPTGSGNRNFVSFTAATDVVNAVGVSGAVIFEVAANYTGSNETFPVKFGAAQGASATNTITFRPATGVTLAVNTTLATSYLFDLDGGSYYVFDGANTANGTTRNWKMINQANGGIFRFINGATNNVVRNMNLMNNSTALAYSPVYFASAAGGNSNNTIRANTLGDSSGTMRIYAGVYMVGTSAAPNIGNSVDGNDIVNFGTTTGYGIYVASYNQLTKILRNRINQSVPGASGTKYGIYFTNGYNLNDTIAYNKIWGLNTTSASSAQYAIYISVQGTSPIAFHNNMIALNSDQGTLYGIYQTEPDSLYVDHNSIYFSGNYASGSTTSYMYYNSATSSISWVRNNVFVNERVSTGSNTNRVYYVTSATSTLNSNYNVIYTNGASTVPFYFGGTYQTTLADWRTATNNDINSYSVAVPFVNAANADLHINPQPIFRGEGVGTPLGYTLDFDQQSRDLAAPDMGADDGDFNGDGLRIVSPNGDEKMAVDYDATVRFTANRVMSARVDISADNGATWITGPVVNTVAGTNTVIVRTPNILTTQAMVRAVNTRNQYEFDRSDNTFELVRPIFTIVAPNGGERLVPTDTVKIQWNSQFVPTGFAVELDYSTDAGATWQMVTTSAPSLNLPTLNSFDWVVPNLPTTQAMVRVKVPGSSINDVSDAVFTIVTQPGVTLTKPNGGEKFFAGDKRMIEWTTTTTDYLKLEYSTDAGLSWTTIINRVAAYRGSYEWTLPDVNTASALVRATNTDRTRFSDQSDNVFSILKDQITVTAPNGGEKYEMNDPVTVRWNASNVATVRIDYSTNNGLTWAAVGSGVNATTGSYTFTPQAVPTKQALVRVVNTEREATQDRSDKVFEILDAKSITILSPGAGDEYVRGSSTVITWNAPRVTSVSIQYSSNGGSSWTTVVSNVQASLGSYVWTVPSALTKQGIIRITEVGGSIVAESGMFSIVNQTVTTVRVISPNGGESYTEGDAVVIRWTATSDLTTVGLSYSSDGGTTWKVITPNATASSSQYNWVAPSVAGTEYRVKVEGGTSSDISDGNFEVVRKPQPKITVLSPNGGEKLSAEQQVSVTWSVQDITGMVAVGYSVDNGATWKPIGTAQATAGSINWNVPSEPTTKALVAVASLDVAGAADTSNGVFTIQEKVVQPIIVTAPNGGEVWMEKDVRTITWNAPDDITQVEMHYSTDGGQSWKFIASSASVAGANSYDWTVPQDTTTRGLVRVRAIADTMRADVSDALFTIVYSPLSVPDGAVAGRSVVSVLGNFPNPFAATTEFRWTQSISGQAGLRLFDGGGHMVRMVEIGRMETGEHRLTLDASELPSGTYHYELRVGGTAAYGVIMIVR